MMMTILLVLDALICAAICVRVIFYRRRAAVHRPRAALLAWVIVCASGSVALLAALSDIPPPSFSDVVLHAVLCLIVFAARGNVAELFHTEDDNAVYRAIRRSKHAQG
jgi:hypothetical protein